MNVVQTPQSRCHVGIARADITPPVGIYNRMWGAAIQDRATAVHRPLLANALWLLPADGQRSQGQLLVTLDHCLLDRAEMTRLRQAAAAGAGIDTARVHVALSHTHGSGYLTRARSHLPGGELIAPVLDALAATCTKLAAAAAADTTAATILYGTGSCRLAAQRNYWDRELGQFVCGFNPGGAADDTVLVARLVDERDKPLATLINYACHPTTLAWQNSAISPDYVGMLREVVEAQTGAPCLFLQGASADLGPREGFVGDWNVADRNGRQLGYAALAALEALPPAGTQFEYAGAVLSGTRLGTWAHRPVATTTQAAQAAFSSRQCTVPLAYREDMPSLELCQRQLAEARESLGAVEQTGDDERLRTARAQAEQAQRQLDRVQSLPSGDAYPYEYAVLRLGQALWVLAPGELYQDFQIELRRQFPDWAILVATVVNDWHPGYVPTSDSYPRNVYEAQIAAIAPDSLRRVTDAVIADIAALVHAEPGDDR